MARKATRWLLCTEKGHFKEYLVFSDGSCEYGTIGKKRTRYEYGTEYAANDMARKKLYPPGTKVPYRELTEGEHKEFMEGYAILCDPERALTAVRFVSANESKITEVAQAAKVSKRQLLL